MFSDIFDYYNILSKMSICCPTPASQSMIMFQQMINKSFQIIKTILPRTNSLFQLNEQLQRSVSNLQRKLMRIQLDNDNIHYQMRTNNLALQNKVANLQHQFTRFNNETMLLKKQSQMLVKSVKEVKSIQQLEKKDQQENENQVMHQQRTRKIIFEDEVQAPQKLEKKDSIEVSQQQIQQPPKVHFNLIHSKASIDYSQRSQCNSQISLNRKSNLKQIKNQGNFISSKNLKKRDDKKYQQFLKEIEKYHHDNETIKKNYQKLIDSYYQQNQQQFKNIYSQLNQICQKVNIKGELYQKVWEKKQSNLHQINKNNTNDQIKYSEVKVDKNINYKLGHNVFEASIKEINDRLSTLSEVVCKFANRQQTKRAILCLQNKINTIFREEISQQIEKKQPSVHYVEIDQKGCLRTNLIPDEKLDNTHKNLIRHSQIIEQTQRTTRNEQRKQRRLMASMHSNQMNGALTEGRFNEQRKSLFLERASKGEEENIHPSDKVVKIKQITLLKQKSVQILQKAKIKGRPKLKKQRLIFEYD